MFNKKILRQLISLILSLILIQILLPLNSMMSVAEKGIDLHIMTDIPMVIPVGTNLTIEGYLDNSSINDYITISYQFKDNQTNEYSPWIKGVDQKYIPLYSRVDFSFKMVIPEEFGEYILIIGCSPVTCHGSFFYSFLANDPSGPAVDAHLGLSSGGGFSTDKDGWRNTIHRWIEVFNYGCEGISDFKALIINEHGKEIGRFERRLLALGQHLEFSIEGFDYVKNGETVVYHFLLVGNTSKGKLEFQLTENITMRAPNESFIERYYPSTVDNTSWCCSWFLLIIIGIYLTIYLIFYRKRKKEIMNLQKINKNNAERHSSLSIIPKSDNIRHPKP